MDPQAAWDQLFAAVADGDWDLTEELATGLLAWLGRGGFPPTIVQQTHRDDEWNRVLARAGCLHALNHVQEAKINRACGTRYPIHCNRPFARRHWTMSKSPCERDLASCDNHPLF